MLSRIQGYRYHLSKFHTYALVYCIGVFLSGLVQFLWPPGQGCIRRECQGTESASMVIDYWSAGVIHLYKKIGGDWNWIFRRRTQVLNFTLTT